MASPTYLYRYLLLVPGLLGVLSSGLAAADQRPLLTLAADDWCPYNCSVAAAPPGYVLELARAIFEPLGVRVTYRRQPWARTLQAVRNAEVSAAIGATRDELPLAIFPAEPIGQFQGYLIQRREADWHYHDNASLQGKRLGVINSYDYGPFNTFLDSLRGSPDLAVLSGDDAGRRALAMLVRGRLDGYVEDRAVALYTARQMGVADQVRVDAPVAPPLRLYLAFSAQDPAAARYAQLWTAGIRSMRADGRLAAILARYGVSDWAL